MESSGQRRARFYARTRAAIDNEALSLSPSSSFFSAAHVFDERQCTARDIIQIESLASIRRGEPVPDNLIPPIPP